MSFGGGGSSIAVVGYLSALSPFWRQAWIAIIHLIVVLLAACLLFKAMRAMLACMHRVVADVGGGRESVLAVADKGVLCKFIICPASPWKAFRRSAGAPASAPTAYVPNW